MQRKRSSGLIREQRSQLESQNRNEENGHLMNDLEVKVLYLLTPLKNNKSGLGTCRKLKIWISWNKKKAMKIMRDIIINFNCKSSILSIRASYGESPSQCSSKQQISSRYETVQQGDFPRINEAFHSTSQLAMHVVFSRIVFQLIRQCLESFSSRTHISLVFLSGCMLLQPSTPCGNGCPCA